MCWVPRLSQQQVQSCIHQWYRFTSHRSQTTWIFGDSVGERRWLKVPGLCQGAWVPDGPSPPACSSCLCTPGEPLWHPELCCRSLRSCQLGHAHVVQGNQGKRSRVSRKPRETKNVAQATCGTASWHPRTSATTTIAQSRRFGSDGNAIKCFFDGPTCSRKKIWLLRVKDLKMWVHLRWRTDLTKTLLKMIKEAYSKKFVTFRHCSYSGLRHAPNRQSIRRRARHSWAVEHSWTPTATSCGPQSTAVISIFWQRKRCPNSIKSIRKHTKKLLQKH